MFSLGFWESTASSLFGPVHVQVCDWYAERKQGGFVDRCVGGSCPHIVGYTSCGHHKGEIRVPLHPVDHVWCACRLHTTTL